MSRRLHRIWLLPLLFLVGQAWALGLGDIRISSALNQPLRAEIVLLAATAEELNNLQIQLASAETFSRYDLDRPLYLTRLQFEIVKSGTADGNIIRVHSLEPVTEPFITFLVEAVWSRGRLLREYTLLLDPPTFAAPPTIQSTQAVEAPVRATPTDSGQIQRPVQQQAIPEQPAPRPVQAPVQTQEPVPTPQQSAPAPVTQQPAVEPRPEYIPPERPDDLNPVDFDSTPGGDLLVIRGDTLWGITARVRPDSRLTFNQTMLAIFEANPDAFEGNINRLKAGASLRIPAADEIFSINRGDAFSEVQRQNNTWSGLPPAVATTPTTETTAEPNLTLVPPDDEDLSLSDTGVSTDPDGFADDTADDVFVDPTDQRIREIEALIEDQDSLIEIPDNELAALRQELAELRGEEPPELLPVEDELEDLAADGAEDAAIDDQVVADDTAADSTTEQPVDAIPAVVSRPPPQQGIVDTILGYLTNFWVIIGVALVVAVLLLVWFMRRAASGDDDSTGVWETLDDSAMDPESLASTESLRTIVRDDESTILVEEQVRSEIDDLQVEDLAASGIIEAPAEEDPSGQFDPTEQIQPDESFDLADTSDSAISATADPLAESGSGAALDDTFSSETAINLDQSDPVAEADFHMAYGLYDQAADLINGALSTEPERQDLLAKLCEIYFVWGNRDAFVDAAGRLQAAVGDEANAEWDKIVIMGQQIAGENAMFSGVSAAGATKAVDLSFEGSDEDTGALDMNLSDEPDDAGDDVIDLGSETGQVLISPESGGDIDFSFDEADPAEASATREMPDLEADDTDTAASEGADASPTIEQQFEVLDATGELPSLSELDTEPPASDATAEIDLDDLGLDLDSIADSSLAADLSDDDLEETAQSRTLKVDDLDITGSNLGIDDLDATGQSESLDDDAANDKTGIQEGIDIAAAMG
ncbi:MAG: pilus assembly protein FimV, partial [Woeseiaceae bacterium]